MSAFFMRKSCHFLITEEQEKLLRVMANDLGFSSISDYIRFVLFMSPSFVNKIDRIYEKVCGND